MVCQETQEVCLKTAAGFEPETVDWKGDALLATAFKRRPEETVEFVVQGWAESSQKPTADFLASLPPEDAQE